MEQTSEIGTSGRLNGMQVLGEFTFDPQPLHHGYANRTLYVDLNRRVFESRPVSQQMKELFVGGRGFGLWLLWNGVQDHTQWDDPENELIISSGPLGGITQFPGSGKSIVVTISPTTQSVVDSNVGGYFGPFLKFTGWDALEIQGKSQDDLIVYIDGLRGKAYLLESTFTSTDTHLLAEEILEAFAQSEEEKLQISSVTAGRGADHSYIGCLNVSLYDPRRGHIRVKQAGRGGTGTVFRDKGLKALVVKSPPLKGDLNHPADPEIVSRIGRKMNREVVKLDPKQNNMRKVGTAFLVDIIDYHHLLPVENFRFGSHPDSVKISGDVYEDLFIQGLPDGCWFGCTMSCSHTVEDYLIKSGPYQRDREYVDGPEYETIAGVGSNCGIFDPQIILEMNFYCDTYGLDTISVGTLTAFVMECYERGILNQEMTGGLKLNFGNGEAALQLLHQIGHGVGFGQIAGQGIRRMKRIFAEQYGADPETLEDIGMEAKGMEFSEYVTKETLAQQGGYGLANKGAQHDEAWLIFLDLVNDAVPTMEEKAEALYFFPLWRTWFGLNGLCKTLWNDVEPEDNRERYGGMEAAKVPEHIQNYVQLFAGVTGRQDVTCEEDLIRMSEVPYNFQRLFNLRLGYGTREHDSIPYRAMGPVTETEYLSREDLYDNQLKDELGLDPREMEVGEKIARLREYREGRYQKLVDAVYQRRGWDPRGIPTRETLSRLGLDLPEIMGPVERYLGGQ